MILVVMIVMILRIWESVNEFDFELSFSKENSHPIIDIILLEKYNLKPSSLFIFSI